MEAPKILSKYKISITLTELLIIWNEPHRFYHNSKHLYDILGLIEADHAAGQLTETEYGQLIIVALFHDIVYDPAKSDNEDMSAAFLKNISEDNADLNRVIEAILDTKHNTSATPLARRFNRYDMAIVERPLNELIEWEQGIYEEYKIFGKDVYKAGRIAFLNELIAKYPHNAINLQQLADHVNNSY